MKPEPNWPPPEWGTPEPGWDVPVNVGRVDSETDVHSTEPTEPSEPMTESGMPPDMTEEEFLRRVADPDRVEARARRRARHRAEEAGLTEEQLRDREDEKFRQVTENIGARELYWRLPPGKRRKKKPHRSPSRFYSVGRRSHRGSEADEGSTRRPWPPAQRSMGERDPLRLARHRPQKSQRASVVVLFAVFCY
jgi:hypothetical protein